MTEKEKLKEIKKLADAMYYAAFNLTTDTSLLKKAMNEYHQFIVHEYHKEEPVSDEMEKVVEEIVDPTVLNAYGVKEIVNRLRRTMIEPVSEDLEEVAIQFATDTETGKVDVVKQSSFLWGAIYHKQQMMAKAVNVEVKVDAGGYPYIDRTIELYDYDKDIPLAKEGDKYKVILIKED